MQVAAATPQAAGRLLAICSDVTKFLAVGLREGMWQRLDSLNSSWDLVALGRVTRNKGRVTGIPSSDRWVVDSCLMLTTSKPRSPRPPAMSSAGVLMGRWRITALMGFSDFGKE
jgi:hypothetical protein